MAKKKIFDFIVEDDKIKVQGEVNEKNKYKALCSALEEYLESISFNPNGEDDGVTLEVKIEIKSRSSAG